MKKRNAFTLAEVLITLGIIGVVAAMTLPTVVNNIQNKENINKLKREYSIMQQAFQKIAAENDANFKNALAVCANASNKHACLKNIFKAKLNTINDCDINNGENLSKCFVSQADAKQLNGKPVKSSAGYFNNNTTSGLVLNDGSSVAFWLDDTNCITDYAVLTPASMERCGWIVIDVNGPSARPNTWGKDIFLFFIYSKRILPADPKYTGDTCNGLDEDIECVPGADDCGAGINYGLTCSYKYLYE